MEKPTPSQYYIDRLNEIASRVGWALPEQTTADLKDLAVMLEKDNATFVAPAVPRRFSRHTP